MKTAWVTFLAAVLLGLAGCNTMEGIGKDVEKAGELLQGAAKKK